MKQIKKFKPKPKVAKKTQLPRKPASGAKTKKAKKVSSVRGLNTTQQRMKHITDMYSWGHAGVRDYSELNDTVIPETVQYVDDRQLKVLSPEYDVNHHDLPRGDIKRYDIKSDDYVRIGGDSEKNIRAFSRWAFPIIGKAFSNDELESLRLYYDYPSRNRMFKSETGDVVLGLTSSIRRDQYYRGLPHSLIEFHRVAMGDEPTLIHETVHAIRAAEGIEIEDQDKDEAFVELETLARLSPRGYKQMLNLPGYYSYLTNSKEKMREDRVLLTGGINKSLVGRNATRRVAEVFPQTNLYRMKGATSSVTVDRKGVKRKITKRLDLLPEHVDRYFELVTPDNIRRNIHVRFKKSVSTSKVVTMLKARNPTAKKISEWHDGKLKVIYSSRKTNRPTTTQTRKTTVKRGKKQNTR